MFIKKEDVHQIFILLKVCSSRYYVEVHIEMQALEEVVCPKNDLGLGPDSDPVEGSSCL